MDPIKASIWYLLRFHFSEETCSSVRVFPIILFFAEYLTIYGLIYRVPSSYNVTSSYGDASPTHLSLQSFLTLVKLHHKKKKKKNRPGIATWTHSSRVAASTPH